MKLVFVTPYRPLADGIRYYSENLITGFRRVRSGLHIGIIPWNYPSKPSRLFKPLLRTRNIISKFSFADVIHIQYVASLYLWNLLSPLVLMRRRGSQAKIVLTLHETNDNTKPKWFFDFIQNLYLSLADSIIVHSNYHRGLLPKTVQRKTFVIPHGVPLFPLDRSVKRDLRLLLLPGFINRWKGYDVAVRALALLRKQGVDLRMTILGKAYDTAYTRELRLLVEELKLDSFVRFETDFVSDKRFRQAFQEAGIVILPYKRIAMSGILSHAIAYQAPTIMSDLTPFREYTQGRGIYFKVNDHKALADQIKCLLVNKSLQKEQSNLFAKLKREYSYEQIAHKTLKLYARILS